MQIVIAWADTDAVVTKQGRIDLGERHQFKSVIVGNAAMWINDGTDEDMGKAAVYASRENDVRDEQTTRGNSVRCVRVFTYPATEKDPLGRAKLDVVKLARL